MNNPEHAGQDLLTVAVLGPLGTYTHEAAQKRFGLSANYHERDTIKAVFEAVLSSPIIGVVPQENNLFGTVVETYDALRETGFVRGEIILQVQHCLVAQQGVKFEDIREVFSHEQALGQCRKFIQTHLPGVSLIKTSSTAAAARSLLDRPPNCAAICSRACVLLFTGLTVLREGVQDTLENFTRFYIIAKNDSAIVPVSSGPPPLGNALLCISTENPTTSRSVAKDISHLLSSLHMHVTRIDRRPSFEKRLFHSTYFVELEMLEPRRGRDWREEVQRAIHRVKEEGGHAQLTGIW